MQHLNSHLGSKNDLFSNMKSKTQFIPFLSYFLFDPPINSISLQLSNNFLQSPDDFQSWPSILSKQMNRLILPTNNHPIFVILSICLLFHVTKLIQKKSYIFPLFLKTQYSLYFCHNHNIIEYVQFDRKIQTVCWHLCSELWMTVYCLTCQLTQLHFLLRQLHFHHPVVITEVYLLKYLYCLQNVLVVNVKFRHFLDVFPQKKSILEHSILRLLKTSSHSHVLFLHISSLSRFLKSSLNRFHLTTKLLK